MQQKYDTDFIRPFLIDPELTDWDGNLKTDAGKCVRDILLKLKDSPASVSQQDVRKAVWANGSQIGNKPAYFQHIIDVAGNYEQVADMLLSKDSQLSLPQPKIARARGLVHDLDSIVARYGGEFKGYKFAQHDKQLTEYFLFKGLGLEELAQEVPMHCGYFELLQIIAGGEGFPEIKMYEDWTHALNEPGNPLNIANLRAGFAGFLQARDNLPLMALAVSDYLDNNKPFFDLATIEADFTARRDDILNRYYYNKKNQCQEPTPLGKALVELNGVGRINKYFSIISAGLKEGIPYNENTRGFFLSAQTKQAE